MSQNNFIFEPSGKNAICETRRGAVVSKGRFTGRRISLNPRFSGCSRLQSRPIASPKNDETVLASVACVNPLKRGVHEHASGDGNFFAQRIISADILLSPCGAEDSLLKKFLIAAINADFGNVIVLAPACPSFGSFKTVRLTAGGFGRRRGSAKCTAPAGQDAFSFFPAAADRPLNLSRNGSRDCSLRRNFSEEKIPAPNKQPKINTTSNRKDASSAYPK